jgi:DNA-directed RNA polymerase specialized sigma24 family protein
MTIDEVAETVGKTPGAVKALQRRGFVAIARVIEREGVPL